MNRQIVFFHQSSAVEHRMIRTLEAGGMKVYTARSPVTMHNLFVRRLVAAVVFPHNLLAKYHIHIRPHLLEAKSPVAVVCWIQRDDGSIATRTVSVGPESINPNASRENRRVANRTALLIRACGSSLASQATELHDTTAVYRTPLKLPQIPGMHRKMRMILEVIAESGTAGSSPEHIIHEIWPATEHDRMKDLQSYISKLRKSLAGTTKPGLGILYQNHRYRLVEGPEGIATSNICSRSGPVRRGEQSDWELYDSGERKTRRRGASGRV